MFTGDFRGDFEAVVAAVEERRPFALSRFNDGEYALLRGRRYNAASGWRIRQGAQLWVTGPLARALQYEAPGWCVGISPDDVVLGSESWYRDQVRVPRVRLTFATLFLYANYEPAFRYFHELDAFRVGSGRGCHASVPLDAVNRPWDVQRLVGKLLEVRKPILLAAGPCAGIIAHAYWERCKPEARVPIIDVGALLDTEIHGRATRIYQEPGPVGRELRRKTSQWALARTRGAPRSPQGPPAPPRMNGPAVPRRAAIPAGSSAHSGTRREGKAIPLPGPAQAVARNAAAGMAAGRRTRSSFVAVRRVRSAGKAARSRDQPHTKPKRLPIRNDQWTASQPVIKLKKRK